ncbi:MAG TPA: hypothetical protein VK400_18685 [Pyrinomonadaceae bacterium]|nr:hypothetical protein [Pyrinomonadaceae bacterium]
MVPSKTTTSQGWLAFELNVLRRLQFASAALPFTGEPNLGAYLKRAGARVTANDLTQSAFVKSVAAIQNNGELLSNEDVEIVLEDAYVPRYELQNPSLRNWFNETDAWWFDNVRQNIERLSSLFARATAMTVAMQAGNYLLSFTEETRRLRQPLSSVFRRLHSTFPAPVNNGQNNVCQNKNAIDFVAETRTDLMFLRLPRAHNLSLRSALGWSAWQEEWLQAGDAFWTDLETLQTGRLGTHVETKNQYLRLVEELLRTAAHIEKWAIAHTEDGFISTHELVEVIGRVRRVDTIFTKDFSELTGMKAVIITA